LDRYAKRSVVQRNRHTIGHHDTVSHWNRNINDHRDAVGHRNHNTVSHRNCLTIGNDGSARWWCS
jgi:hypothetical protein